jgi:alpha-tubulin suppressor-like RCC1 family protein
MRRLPVVALAVLSAIASVASCDLYGEDPPFDDDDAGARPRAVRPSRGVVTDDSGPEVIVLPCPDDAAPSVDATVPVADATVPESDASELDSGLDSGGDVESGPPTLPEACTPTADRPCVVSMALGEAHTCVRLSDGTARCWGKASDGALGIGAPAGTSVAIPTAVVGLTGATNIAAGQKHTCASLDDGSMKCWGIGTTGRLGSGANTASNVPVPVVAVDATAGGNLANVGPIALGQEHTCTAVLGVLTCWGRNNLGQLGIDNKVPAFTARPLVGKLTNVESLSLGSGFSCAVDGSKNLYCWGTNAKGQLGTDSTATVRLDAPAQVANVANVVQATTGTAHTCALFADRSVKCWGDNSDLQLGIAFDATNNPVPSTFTPTKVENLPTGIKQIAAGAKFTCALKDDGTVWCWGSNASNQLGGTQGSEQFPRIVDGVTGAVEIRTGAYHTCARIKDGSVKCWGQNGNLQVGGVSDGAGGTLPTVPTPTTVVWQ